MSSETRSSPVKREREAQGLRLVDLADRAQMSISHISMIEHGYVPAKATREKLAKALDAKPEELWPEVG